MPRKPRHAVIVAALVLAFGAPLAAQSDRAQAEVLFKEARKAMKKQDWASACPKLAESLRLDRAPGTLLNLAECEEKIGELASAWQRFDELTQTLKADDPRMKVARRRAAELDKVLPRLTIVLAPGVPASSSVRIKLDGVELSTASVGVPLPVNPGKHAIVVSAPGRAPRGYDTELARAEKRQLEVELGEATATDEPERAAPRPVTVTPTPATKPRERSAPIAGYVIGGAGVVALAVSAVAGGVALGKKSKVDEECGDEFCTDEGLDAADSGKRWSTIATVAFAGGAVLTGIGVYLVLSHDRERTTALGVAPQANGARFSLSGRF